MKVQKIVILTFQTIIRFNNFLKVVKSFKILNCEQYICFLFYQ